MRGLVAQLTWMPVAASRITSIREVRTTSRLPLRAQESTPAGLWGPRQGVTLEATLGRRHPQLTLLPNQSEQKLLSRMPPLRKSSTSKSGRRREALHLPVPMLLTLDTSPSFSKLFLYLFLSFTNSELLKI